MSDEIGIFNFCTRAGNTGTTQNENGLVIRVTANEAAVYSYAFKTADFTGGPIVKTTDITLTPITVDGVDYVDLTIPILTTETRAMAAHGQDIAYEVERRTATTQKSFLAGQITPLQGINDD